MKPFIVTKHIHDKVTGFVANHHTNHKCEWLVACTPVWYSCAFSKQVRAAWLKWGFSTSLTRYKTLWFFIVYAIVSTNIWYKIIKERSDFNISQHHFRTQVGIYGCLRNQVLLAARIKKKMKMPKLFSILEVLKPVGVGRGLKYNE